MRYTHLSASIITTGVTGRTRWQAFGLSALLLIVSLGVLATNAGAPGPSLPAFLPSYSTGVVIGDLLTAFMLLNQARLVGRLSLFMLSGAYLFTGLIAAIQLLTFPGVFSENGLLGAGPQSAVWLWMFWHGGFPLFLICFAMIAPIDAGISSGGRAGTIGWAWIAGTILLVVGSAVLTTRGQDLLPTLVVKGDYARSFALGVAPLVLALNGLAVVLLAVRTRFRTVVQLWLWVAALAALLDAILTLTATNRFSIGWYMARVDSLIASAIILAAFLGEMIRLYGEIMALNERLSQMVAIDGLTGIANRRRFDEALEQEWGRALRQNLPIGLLMLDVDYFKRYNDALGHPAGDTCLKAVAGATLPAPNRPGDLAARYGGEEFVVLLPNTNAEGALIVANQVRERIRALGILHPNGADSVVTVSIGVASAVPTKNEKSASLLAAADGALYAAKEAGRDRAVVAPRLETETV